MTWNINVTVEETAWGDQRQLGLEASVLPTNPTLCPLDICGFYLPPPPLGTTPSLHSDQFSFLCELALTPGSMGGHVAQMWPSRAFYLLCPSVWVSNGSGSPVRRIPGVVQEVPEERSSLLGRVTTSNCWGCLWYPSGKAWEWNLTFQREAERLMLHIITWVPGFSSAWS